MLRRIVSLGQPASERDDNPMSPTSNDANRSSESKNTAVLAGVFKGLTGAKLTKSPPATSSALLPPPLLSAAASSVSVSSTYPPSSDVTDTDSNKNPSYMSVSSYIEYLEQLKNGAINERIAAASALRASLADSTVDSKLDVWHAARDLIDSANTLAAREPGWDLLAECAKHTSCTTLERKEIFYAITTPADTGDFHLQLSALTSLTSNGRDLSGFEYDVFPLLTQWFHVTYRASRAAAKIRSSSSSGGGKTGGGKSFPLATAAETNLAHLFAYSTDVLKYNFKIASDRAMDGFLDAIIHIAMNTSTEDDLSACVNVISTCVIVGAMPNNSLDSCVKVLCSIYCLVARLRSSAWTVLSNIFKSHHGIPTVRILLNTLRNYPEAGVESKEATRQVRGALTILQKLVTRAGSGGYPPVSYGLLVDGLRNVANATPSPRVVALTLQLINRLFGDSDSQIRPLIVDEGWAPLLDVAISCARRSTPLQLFNAGNTHKQTRLSVGGLDESSPQAMVDSQAAVLTARIEAVLRGLLAARPEYAQRNSCIAFLASVHPILPDSGAELVLKHFQEFRCCFPSDPQWDANIRLVLDAFYAQSSRSAFIRLLALRTAIDVIDVLALVGGAIDSPDAVPNLVRHILVHIGDERDTVILHQIVSFAVDISPSMDMRLYEYILDSLVWVIKSDERRQPSTLTTTGDSLSGSSSSPTEKHGSFIDQSTSNIAARALSWIFMKVMNFDAEKAVKAFDTLLLVAKDRHCPNDARLTAFKLFFRLRADWANRIFLVENTESDRLAAVLLRTESSMDHKITENSPHQAQNIRPIKAEVGGPSPPPILHPQRTVRGVSHGQGGPSPNQDRTATSTRRASGAIKHQGSFPAHYYRQLWTLPDPDALPESPSSNASPVLFSYQGADITTTAIGSDNKADSDEEDNTCDFNRGDSHDEGHENRNENCGIVTASSKGAGQDNIQIPLLTLKMSGLMEVVFDILNHGDSWEIYSFVLVHLPSQLSNHAICRGAVKVILRIRAKLCDQMRLNNSQEPPATTGLRRPDAQTCILQSLTMILSYHEYFSRQEEDDLVHTFIAGLLDKNPITCVQALSICCFELPNATAKSLVTILQKMSRIITRPGVAMHILELLACLSRLPWLYSNFREDEYRIAFGVCFRYLQNVRDRRSATARVGHYASGSDPQTTAVGSSLGTNLGTTPGMASIYGADNLTQSSDSLPGQLAASGSASSPGSSDDLPEYVYALAYHGITYWFLALRVPDRASYVSWIASRLFVESDGRQIMEEQAQVTLNFMQQAAFFDGDESVPNEDDRSTEELSSQRSWIVGDSIITIQQRANKPGWAIITKRQPSSTSYYTIQENLQPRPSHQTRGVDGSVEGPLSSSAQQTHRSINVTPYISSAELPSHLLTQLIAPVPQPYDSPLRPIPLPDDDSVARAFRAFDRNSTVDGHKVGVIYIGEGQTDEAEILANVSGGNDYVDFLNGLGTLVRLKGASFNTQGLDREYDTDGAYAFCWRDRVTEMVFHVTTQMPTDRQRDPSCINKKRHIGNDFVNIIFNDSGLPFRFDTFPSEFNYVYIVISPESRASFVARREVALEKQKKKEEAAKETIIGAQADSKYGISSGSASARYTREAETAMPFYKVQVMSKPGFPEISPAAETKIIGLQALPDFIRLLALNASVFSQVWSNRQGGEHLSSWGNRLRQIKRLRERYQPSSSLPSSAIPIGASGGSGDGGSGISVPGDTTTATSGAGGSFPGASGGGLVIGAGAGVGGTGTIGSGGGGLGGVGMRDSFNSLRRSSMATFFTTASDINSHRSSVHSTGTNVTTTTMPESTDVTAMVGTGGGGGGGSSAGGGASTKVQHGSTDSWVNSLDFSQWTQHTSR